MALYKLEPWGDDWLQAGTITAALYNLKRKRSSKPIEPTDFYSRPYHKDRRKSTEEMQALFMAAAKVNGK